VDNSDKILRADLLESTWLGVSNKLQSLFSKDSGVCGRDIEVVSSVDPDDVEYMQQQKGSPLELPIIAVAPIQVEPDINSYNTSVLRKYGAAIKISDDRANWTVVKLAPVLMTFQVVFITDDVLTMLRMMGTWMANELWSFKLKQADWTADIQIQVDKTIAVPPRVQNQGGARQFKLATTLRAKTYSGYIWYIPAIRTVEVDHILSLAGTIEEAMANPKILSDTFNVQTIDSNPYLSPVIYQPEN